MTILLFLFGVAVAAGLFFILADILKLPRLSTEKALLSAGPAKEDRVQRLHPLFLGSPCGQEGLLRGETGQLQNVCQNEEQTREMCIRDRPVP